MGKVTKNGFCYISVNTILKITSQYNTSLGSLYYRTIFFPALQSAPNSDSYQVNSTSSNVMSSGFISNSTFQFSSKWCESFTRV